MPSLLAIATAKTSVWEKIQSVPKETWISLGVAILVLIILVKVWRWLAEINEFIPWIALVTIGGAVIVYWTYERTEPKLLSPIFDFLAQYLPSRIEYKQ